MTVTTRWNAQNIYIHRHQAALCPPEEADTQRVEQWETAPKPCSTLTCTTQQYNHWREASNEWRE